MSTPPSTPQSCTGNFSDSWSAHDSQVKQVVLGPAKRIVVPMDRTKLGAADFALVCTLDDIITDEPSEYLPDICQQAGVELIVAAPISR